MNSGSKDRRIDFGWRVNPYERLRLIGFVSIRVSRAGSNRFVTVQDPSVCVRVSAAGAR